ncbi:unnamed protein product [Alopecurus aequalis]
MPESPLAASPINRFLATWLLWTRRTARDDHDRRDDDVAEEETMNARQVAAISAMIHDVAKEAATGSSSSSRKRRRMCSTRSYEETCTLGEGSFGVVAKACHRATGQTVALKTPLDRGESVDLLLREACFMAACRGHPNAVALCGIARAPGTSDYSIVMEYVGPTLHDVLHDRKFTEADMRGIMRQLLSAAAAMHGHGIIHRDIKPNNIFVVAAGDDAPLVVKIGDYGEAMSTVEHEPADGAYSFAGTMSYMAPEMLLEKPDYDTGVDTWSLGCVMAELLTGKRLFKKADAETDQLYKIFDLLGVPGKKAYREFNSPFLADEVQVWRREQQRRGRYRSRLREMFPEKTLSKEGFEVLNGLLACSPSKRLDAAAALRLPWFADTGDHAPAPVVAAVSKTGGASARIWALASCSWQVALAYLGCALRSVRPKAV